MTTVCSIKSSIFIENTLTEANQYNHHYLVFQIVSFCLIIKMLFLALILCKHISCLPFHHGIKIFWHSAWVYPFIVIENIDLQRTEFANLPKWNSANYAVMSGQIGLWRLLTHILLSEIVINIRMSESVINIPMSTHPGLCCTFYVQLKNWHYLYVWQFEWKTCE